METVQPGGELIAFTPAFVERRLAAALEADEAGDLAAALHEIQSALELAPKEPRAQALAGVYCGLLDRDCEALIHARRALRLTENAEPSLRAEVAYWVGVARHMVGAHESALQALELALELAPEDEAAQALSERCRRQLTA
ncbi:MAG: hypothetical protein AAF909_02040 [Pseudomonadota bacterium]